MNYARFKERVWEHYRLHGRHSLPWRKTRDPYKILVSEVMLQQTQVERVIPKYKSFVEKFPTLESLSTASLRTVLKSWQGLGYNRRAVSLKRTCEQVLEDYGGKFPRNIEDLTSLPGIGEATAGDILAFAYDLPAVVIETNIRTVFIHHFFRTKPRVTDKDLTRVIEATLPEENVREWYYALMDYGAHLKKVEGNNIAQSAHYRKQSKFKGSNRELRSHILKLVLKRPRTKAEIVRLLSSPAPSINKNLIALTREGLIRKRKMMFVA